jgi:hypothetical protein
MVTGFRPPAGGRVHFLARPRKRNQKRGALRSRPPALRAGGSAHGYGGSPTAHPVLTSNWPASLPATLRALSFAVRRFSKGEVLEIGLVCLRTSTSLDSSFRWNDGEGEWGEWAV